MQLETTTIMEICIALCHARENHQPREDATDHQIEAERVRRIHENYNDMIWNLCVMKAIFYNEHTYSSPIIQEQFYHAVDTNHNLFNPAIQKRSSRR